jgi:hypothetical protein
MSEIEPRNLSEEPEPVEEEWDVSPFFEYLKTPQGHEVATRVLKVIEDVKKATLVS